MTFPKVKVKEPACLHGVENGKIPDSLLVNTPGQDGGAVVRLVAPAARAWKALCAAALAAGHVLQATSAMDSFRPYAVQEQIFRERYTTTHLPGRPSRVWNGKTYWQKPGTAAAAVPGTSNHGRGLAVDTREKSGALTKPALDWLLDNAQLYGWSWELDSEPWHLHYFAGDNTPAAVLASDHPIATHPQEELVRNYIVVTIPKPDAKGLQIVGTDFDFDKVASASLKANDDGRPVKAIVQPFAYGKGCALSFIGTDGQPLTVGAKIGVVVTTVA